MTDTNYNTSTVINSRASYFYRILRDNFFGEPEENLVELLIYAMHWCDQFGCSFEDALKSAHADYVFETQTNK